MISFLSSAAINALNTVKLMGYSLDLSDCQGLIFVIAAALVISGLRLCYKIFISISSGSPDDK